MERFQELREAQAQEMKLKDLIVKLRIEDEVKANVMEDSKGKSSTSKCLKWKKTALEYKVKDQEGRNKFFKGTCYNCDKKGYKADNYCSCPKKNNKGQPQTNMIDYASPSLSAVALEVNLTTNNKDWW